VRYLHYLNTAARIKVKSRRAVQNRLQAARLYRRLAEGKRAQTGLLSKVKRHTRRAPEPYR
jgi:hypothetical protein